MLLFSGKQRAHSKKDTPRVTLAATFPCIMSRVACCLSFSSFGPNEIPVKVQINLRYTVAIKQMCRSSQTLHLTVLCRAQQSLIGSISKSTPHNHPHPHHNHEGPSPRNATQRHRTATRARVQGPWIRPVSSLYTKDRLALASCRKVMVLCFAHVKECRWRTVR